MAESKKVIMLGNEAIARGAYEAGVKVSAAYPGTPSTEISEYLVQYKDDPGLYSSQNEQDTRMVARAAQLPVLEPADSAEAKEYMKLAYELSEQFDRPFVFRTTTRLAHSQGLVELCERQEVEDKPYVKNVQ